MIGLKKSELGKSRVANWHSLGRAKKEKKQQKWLWKEFILHTTIKTTTKRLEEQFPTEKKLSNRATYKKCNIFVSLAFIFLLFGLHAESLLSSLIENSNWAQVHFHILFMRFWYQKCMHACIYYILMYYAHVNLYIHMCAYRHIYRHQGACKHILESACLLFLYIIYYIQTHVHLKESSSYFSKKISPCMCS